MRWTGVFALTLAFVVPAGAWAAPGEKNVPRVETPHVDKIEIYQYGLYESTSAEKFKDPNAPGGERGIIATVDLVQATSNIPAELETEFGIRYVLDGGPEGVDVPITVVFRFPPPGLKEPGKPKPRLVYSTVIMNRIGDPGNYESYGFDFPWEVVPGVWTIELWYQDRKMAEQKFNVR